MSWLPPLLEQYGFAGALFGVLVASWIFFAWLLLSGRLLPRTWVDRLLDQNNKLSKAVDHVTKAVSEIREAMSTNSHVLSEIQRSGEKEGQ